MVGLKQNRSIQDEKLIEAIFLTNVPQSTLGYPVYGSTATNMIIDARPTANAVANTAVGAGTENMENYRNCKKYYSGIENIHVMRDSLNKLVEGNECRFHFAEDRTTHSTMAGINTYPNLQLVRLLLLYQ